jgi:hypothetical protein
VTERGSLKDSFYEIFKTGRVERGRSYVEGVIA